MRPMWLLIFIACAANSWLLAWDWPVKDPVLAADFASVRDGSFLPGIILQSNEALVRSIHRGELIFYVAGQRHDHRGFPSTPGGTLVIQHDEGFRSVYRNLQADSVRDFAAKVSNTDYKVKQNEIVGMMPIEAGSKPGNIFFQLIDNRYESALNPMIILPRLTDERSPAISATLIQLEGSSVRVPLHDRLEMAQAKFLLFVQIHDSYGLKGYNMASAIGFPQNVQVILNGEIKYDSDKLALLMRSDNSRELFLSRTPFGSFKEVHPADDMLFVGNYTLEEGVNRLTIRASDLRGNRSSVSYRVIRPIQSPQS